MFNFEVLAEMGLKLRWFTGCAATISAACGVGFVAEMCFELFRKVCLVLWRGKSFGECRVDKSA